MIKFVEPHRLCFAAQDWTNKKNDVIVKAPACYCSKNKGRVEMDKSVYEILSKMVRHYRHAIQDVGFAQLEHQKLDQLPDTEAGLIEALQVICDSSAELNRILEECPNSMFIADSDGVCLRVNKAYETMVRMGRDEVLGSNVKDLDTEGIFRPSVCWLTLKEKRRVSVLQDIREIKGLAVTGVPVFNENKALFRVVTNAVKVDEIESLTSYVTEKENQGKSPEETAKRKIVAESDEMKAILQLADVIKDTESSILITGETGVGKGVLASYIHDTSNRSDQKMVNINCGAIPQTLLESELFGYESGAFTGADKKGKPGLIEVSHGGTLFLDEVSELPLLMQVKILHFIQNRRITRVGGTKEIPVDTRIIAASNKSLEHEVEKGTFRSDLYYRLNVIPIYIPPLRDRPKDIRPAAEYFLGMYMEKYNKHMTISEDLLEEIIASEWRGNIRELENYIERVVVTNASNYLLKSTGEHPHAGKNEKTLTSAVDEVERDLMVKAYKKYGSTYKVAEALGMSQATAYRKLKKYINLSQK